MFVDEATIDVIGGAGGRGAVAWRREKYVPYGGPAGGDGGDGGDIVIRADENTDTLSDFVSRKRFTAQKGQQGMGQNRAGRRGKDLVLLVPPGTLILEEQDSSVSSASSGSSASSLMADLRSHGEQCIAARRGRGGYGNAHFKSATRQSPDFAELGEPGEERMIRLELKLVADCGIIGFPSVGKSSLIAAVSAARPKIADYPFTTLVPNLGVVRVADREFVLCDVPGLIEGASEGKGLGDTFLKHIERCGILLHLLDVSRDDLVNDYRTVRSELKKYSPALAKKRELVVLNKIDLLGGDVDEMMKSLKKKSINAAAAISAATKQGTSELMKKLLPIVLRERKQRERESVSKRRERDGELPILRPDQLSERMGAYRIEQRKDGSIVVFGKRLEQFTAMTNFAQQGSRNRFIDVLERIGLKRALGRYRKEDKLPAVFIGKVRVDEYL